MAHMLMKDETIPGVPDVVGSENPMPVTDILGANVKSGNSYFGGEVKTISVTEILDISIQTPATGETILFFKGESSDKAEFNLYEGTTTTVAGTEVDMFSHNRQLATSIDSVIEIDPTVDTLGLQLFHSTLQDARNNVGGSVQNDVPIILAQGTKYLLRAISSTASNETKISLRIIETDTV